VAWPLTPGGRKRLEPLCCFIRGGNGVGVKDPVGRRGVMGGVQTGCCNHREKGVEQLDSARQEGKKKTGEKGGKAIN